MSQPYPRFTARGSPQELGRQHGSQAAEPIRAYLDHLARSLDLSAGQLRSCARKFRPLFAATCPRLLDEIGGLAQGAGVSEADALAVQIRGELGPVASGHADDGACTTFVIGRRGTRQGTILIGQTSDTPAEIEQFAYVLQLLPDDGRPEILMWTFGGMIGYHGLNAYGVAHFANALGGGPAWRLALPHYPLKRLLLETRRVEEAVGLFERVPVCSNGNYVLCDGDGEILDVELTSAGPQILEEAGAGFFVHSNHYLCAAHACRENFEKSLPDSFPRLERMRSLIASRFGSITREDMQAFLADHAGYPTSVCRHPHAGVGDAILPNSGKTVAALIAEPESGRLFVARGNPCQNPFVEHRLSGSA